MPGPASLIRLPIELGFRAAVLAFRLLQQLADALPSETASETPDTVPPARVTISEARPPGPELSVSEPWDGYDSMRAADIQRELRKADPEVAAAVQLYEGSRRGRRTVLAAAERRLQA